MWKGANTKRKEKAQSKTFSSWRKMPKGGVWGGSVERNLYISFLVVAV